jgi:hypothetical protein
VPRFEVSVDISITQGKGVLAGASVAVLIPGTSVPIPQVLYGDRQSPNTLSNPFTTAPGNIDFFLAAPRLVDIKITPTGQPAQTLASVPVTNPTPVAQPIKMGSSVMNWFHA